MSYWGNQDEFFYTCVLVHYRPFALRAHVTSFFMEMKNIRFCLRKNISGSYLKQNNSDLVFQTGNILLK